MVVLGGRLVGVIVGVLTEGNRVDELGNLEDRGAIAPGVVEGIVQPCLQAQAVGDDEVGLHDLGHLLRRRREVMRVGTHGHERGDGGCRVCAGDDVAANAAQNRRGRDDGRRSRACGLLGRV